VRPGREVSCHVVPFAEPDENSVVPRDTGTIARRRRGSEVPARFASGSGRSATAIRGSWDELVGSPLGPRGGVTYRGSGGDAVALGGASPTAHHTLGGSTRALYRSVSGPRRRRGGLEESTVRSRRLESGPFAPRGRSPGRGVAPPAPSGRPCRRCPHRLGSPRGRPTPLSVRPAWTRYAGRTGHGG
jgi:hypothetical protein